MKTLFVPIVLVNVMIMFRYWVSRGCKMRATQLWGQVVDARVAWTTQGKGWCEGVGQYMNN